MLHASVYSAFLSIILSIIYFKGDLGLLTMFLLILILAQFAVLPSHPLKSSYLTVRISVLNSSFEHIFVFRFFLCIYFPLFLSTGIRNLRQIALICESIQAVEFHCNRVSTFLHLTLCTFER